MKNSLQPRSFFAAILCSIAVACVPQTSAQNHASFGHSFPHGPPADAIRSLEEAKKLSAEVSSVTVAYLKDKTEVAEILKTLAKKKNLSTIALRDQAIHPATLSHLRNLKSLRSLTLDRRHLHLDKPELHKAVSELDQLTELHLRWIDMLGG